MLLRQEPTSCFITEAVDARFRGAGAAIRPVRIAQERVARLGAEIPLTNTAWIEPHRCAGFQFGGDHGRIAIYRFAHQRRCMPAMACSIAMPGGGVPA
ncbi:MAG: hypothetical protein AAB150_06255 [Pseudomonadota bacterium]